MSTFVETLPHAHSADRPDRLRWLRGGRVYLWLALISLIVAAISVHYPSTPSYDPWSWLTWGREIEHGHLKIAGGSSWKPLPVIFTTVFALFGSAQPNLWLLVARAGAVFAVLMTGKLTARLTWQLTRGYLTADREGSTEPAGIWARSLLIMPALLAAVAAMVCSAFTPHYPGDMLLGYSEGVAAAFMLVAAERAWDGHHRQAFALGILPALDRPETWIVWGPYGLWLLWKDRRSWRRSWLLVIGLGILMLVLWVGFQKLGGGTAKGLVTHPKHNHASTSAIYSSFPFWHELAYVVWPLTIERVEIAALLELFLATGLILRSRRAAGGLLAAVRHHEVAVVAALFSAFGFCWWLLISLETQAGFAGNPRYAVFGAFTIYVGGCAAYGWAAVGIARLLSATAKRLRARARLLSDRRPPLAIGTVFMALVFVFVPNIFDHRFATIKSIRYEQRYQSQLREGVASLVRTAGGGQKILNVCGSVLTGNQSVTMVAWYLDAPIGFVQALPRKTTPVEAGPNTIFQNSVTSGRPAQPSQAQIQIWSQGWQQLNHTSYRVTHWGPVTMYQNCSKYSNINGKPRN